MHRLGRHCTDWLSPGLCVASYGVEGHLDVCVGGSVGRIFLPDHGCQADPEEEEEQTGCRRHERGWLVYRELAGRKHRVELCRRQCFFGWSFVVRVEHHEQTVNKCLISGDCKFSALVGYYPPPTLNILY